MNHIEVPNPQVGKNADECASHATMHVDSEQVLYEEVLLDVTYQGSGVALCVPFECQIDSIQVKG